MDYVLSAAKSWVGKKFLSSTFGLQQFRLILGDDVVDVIMKGLSRKIKIGDEEDLKKLISEWEHEKMDCAFQGDVEEICSLQNTYIFAISYKHRDYDEAMDIKSKRNIISKVTEYDQALLLKTVAAMKNQHGIDHVILWCDQILRINQPQVDNAGDSSVEWYKYGIFPYFAFPVIYLSTNISHDELHKRVWIRVERSIAQMRLGYILYNQNTSSLGFGLRGSRGERTLSASSIDNALLSISQLLLCGYWEEQKDNKWKKDFQEMREWAFYISSTRLSLHRFPFMDRVQNRTNVDILFNIVNFSVFHTDTDILQEKPVLITDNYFYLNATSWNPNLMNDNNSIWDKNRSHLSHYMGTLHSAPHPYYSFSWWKHSSTGNMIGYLSTIGAAVVIIAEKAEHGFLLFRLPCDDVKYFFGKAVADERVVKMIEECASSNNLNFERGREWQLCYCHRSLRQIPHLDCIAPIENELDILGVIWLPTPFAHVIGYLVDSKRTMSAVPVSEQSIIAEIKSAAEKWNTFIKEKYSDYVQVYSNRVVWIEGTSDDIVTFGFLDYVTRRLIIGEDQLAISNYINLRPKVEVLTEINRVSEEIDSSDIQIYVEELFKKSENVEENISKKEVAMFMLYGGFTSALQHTQFCLFLTGVARKRGYYSTRISSVGSVVQVRVFNEVEQCKFFEKTLSGDQFTAIGFVDPRDQESLYMLPSNVLYDRMQTSEVFPHSIRYFKECRVTAVDMTPIPYAEDQTKVMTFYSRERSEHGKPQTSQIFQHTVLRKLFSFVKHLASSRIGEYIFVDMMRSLLDNMRAEKEYFYNRIMGRNASRNNLTSS